MNDDLLDNIPRGNPNKTTGEIPEEFFADPQEVIENCPFDGTTLIAGACGEELAGEHTEQGRIDIAGAGGGKTVQMISMAVTYRGSIIVVDPKGSVAEATAHYRAEGRHHE